MIDKSKIADAEQQAAIATLQRDLAIAQNQMRQLSEKCEVLQKDNDELAESLRNRAKRDGESSLLMDRLGGLRTQLREVERARDEATNEIAGYQAELQHYKQLAEKNEPEVTVEQYEELQKELTEQKDHSRRQLQDLQSQLEELTEKNQATSHGKAPDNENVLELEVLRQEHDVLTRSLEDRQSELQASQQTGQLLEDELEDAHASIDEMRRQLEKQEEELKAFKEEAEKQASESVSEMLAESIQQEEEFEKSVPVLDIHSAGTMQRKQKSLSMLIGAVVMFIVLEVLSITIGPGELLSVVFQSGSQETTVVEKNRPASKPQSQTSTNKQPTQSSSGQIQR